MKLEYTTKDYMIQSGLWDSYNTVIYPELKRIFKKILPLMEELDMVDIYDFNEKEHHFISAVDIRDYLHYLDKPVFKYLNLIKDNTCIVIWNINDIEYDISFIPKYNNSLKKDLIIITEIENKTNNPFRYSVMEI